MKKLLFAACLFSGLFSYGVSQETTEGNRLIYHDAFDLRNSPTDLLPEDLNGVAQDDPNYYKWVKERWAMLNYDNNTYTFNGDRYTEKDATGQMVSFMPRDGIYYTAGCLYDYIPKTYSYVDDWLIMKNPVKVKGDFYLTFYTRYTGGNLPIEVWYGTTPQPNFNKHNSTPAEITAADANWKLVGEVYTQEEYDQDWQKRVSPVGNIDMPDSIPVYFAFRLNIPNTEGKESHFRFDELSIFLGQPTDLKEDIELSEVILPEGGCELTEAPIVLTVTNNGEGVVKGLGCQVEVYLDDNKIATINDTLADFEMISGETKTATFTKKIQFNENGSYEVQATIFLLDKDVTETDATNNILSAYVEKHDGLTVPVEFVFFGAASTDHAYTGDKAASYWNYDDEGWSWNGTSFEVEKHESPLKSTCITLEKDKLYSFKWKYYSGYKYYFGGRIYQETFAWFIGPVGVAFDPNDTENWKQIHKATEYWQELEEKNFTFRADADGQYQFVLYIYPNPESTLSTYDLRFSCYYIYISEAGPDYGIENFYFPMMAYKTPLHMMKGSHSTKATVTNYGTGEHQAKAKVYFGEKSEANLLGSSDVFTLKESEKKTISFEINIPEERLADFSKENKNKFIATVEMQGDSKDSYAANDENSYEMHVTDTVLSFVANDNPAEYHTYFYSKGGLGILFELKEQDTLTQIAVSFDPTNGGVGSNAFYDVVVRSVVEEGENGKYILGSTYYRNRFERGDQKKVFYHTINPLVLAPGKYVIGVIQPTPTDYLFIHVDNVQGVEAKGVAFSADESLVQTQPGADGNYVGNPYIDAIFGVSSQDVSATDVAVSKIIRPVDMGVFSNNEPVKAKVENIGAQIVENMVVYCQVDDKTYEKTIETLAIGTSTEVEFAVDLSEVGEHVVSVYTSIEADKNKANDTASITVNSQSPVDPTKLDFENCADFAQSNFNPQWKSVDEDGAYVWAYDIDYTGEFAPGAATGVFVLNTFTARGSLVNAISAHGGDKLGVAAAPSSSNVWGSDWLISPALQINTGAGISIWTMQYTGNNTLTPSAIELYVSEVSDKLEDLNEGFVSSAANAGMDEWMQSTFDLSEFAGKTVYVGLRIQQSSTSMLTLIDDIEITNAQVGNQSESVGTVGVQVYPNPATTQVNISAEAQIRSIEVMSTSGAIVYRDGNVNSNEYRLNVEKFVPGVYFIHMNSVEGSAVAKIIVR